jgi:mannose/cellobiose epimerase-like protein (N-acyl-D-glucosamine 2-epimerase family)
MKHTPDFRDPQFLQSHILETLAFYRPERSIDPLGGLYQFYRDDGSVFDHDTRHLVSSTRFVVTHAMALRRWPTHALAPQWHQTLLHAYRFLQEVHRNADGGYAWTLRFRDGQREVLDKTNHAYGLAFVLLAQSHAALAGLDEARPALRATLDLLETRFWESAVQRYADEADAAWNLTAYRGQNANMHMCEALLAAFDATGDVACLTRAATLADQFTRQIAHQTHDWIWEHYHPDWSPDWNYNRHDRTNIFRPWGYQVGHWMEWAKLLLTLERASQHAPECEWMIPRARELFAQAVRHGWDGEHGGMVYGVAPEGDPARDTVLHVCDGDKYHWVQAESIATAAVLAQRTGEGGYWEWYDRFWNYVWRHFVDHRHGAWFRILAPDNHPITDEKSPAGKVDYHNMGACHEALDAVIRD